MASIDDGMSYQTERLNEYEQNRRHSKSSI